MQETRVGSLGWEDPLEKEMATLSSILAWRILWTEESGRLRSMGSQEYDTTEELSHHHMGTFHPKMGKIKERNCVNLTEAGEEVTRKL